MNERMSDKQFAELEKHANQHFTGSAWMVFNQLKAERQENEVLRQRVAELEAREAENETLRQHVAELEAIIEALHADLMNAQEQTK
jgi:BMFP domain-containing protein YqiC